MKKWILALALLAGPAAARDVPTFLPEADVAVRYNLAAPGQGVQLVTLRYDAAARRARVDAAGGYYVLADLAGGHALVVLPALHAVVEAPDFSGFAAEIADADGAVFTRRGLDFVAGLACEKYDVRDRNGSGRACITPGGVILRFDGGDARGTIDLTAIAVAFGAIAPGKFQAPAGFARMTLPPGALTALLQQR